MWLSQDNFEIEQVHFLNSDKPLAAQRGELNDDQLIELYKWMVKVRVFDQRAMKLQRQGRIGTYAPLQGQEAAQIGSAFALEQEDWVYPSYREVGVSITRGMAMSSFFLYAMGHPKGLQQTAVNVFPVQIIIGAQCLHAVGGAWADQYREENHVNVAYIGDGGTSEGDFHEALNFAGVYKLPVIFFVQNNQWAISVPLEKQTASKSIAQKALAYGIEGIQVDGNDVVAVYHVMKDAIARAKQGRPVLIEAITFRQGPHTTADDPKKYRTSEEEKPWREKDPITRTKAFLTSAELWDEEKEEKLLMLAEEEVSQGYKEALEVEKGKLEDLFQIVTDPAPPQLVPSSGGQKGEDGLW